MVKLDKNVDKKDLLKKNTLKNFPSSTREWDNSIYTFNKNKLNLIPEVSKLTMKLIRSYFNLYNNSLENKLRKLKIRKRIKRLSSNKIYVSNGVFKHTNNKVIISIYVYNRQKINTVYFMRRNFRNFFKKSLIKKLLLIKYKLQNFINKAEINRVIVFELLSKENNWILLNKYKSLYKKSYDHNIYLKLLKRKLFRKYKKYFLYKQMLYINKSKFNYNYLYYLSNLLKKIYDKNVQFDIINLKSFYLNSYIFTESILLKIKRDRRKLIRKLKQIILKSKINKISKLLSYKYLTKNNFNTNSLNNLILNNLFKNKKSIKNTVLSLLKYKRVTGVRLEAHGRLTKRYTASKSVSKLRYKGNLRNIDSSYLGLSSVLLKGNLRSNVQYTKLKSKTRIGSFGLKGWISGY